MPEYEIPATASADGEQNDSTRPKRRRWRILLLTGTCCLLGFAIVLGAASGPAFPLLAETLIPRIARSQGLEGSLEVEGSIWSRVTVRDVRFAGSEDSPLLSLELREATLDHRPIALAFSFAEFGWLEALEVADLTVAIDLPDDAEAGVPPPNDDGPGERRDDFHPAWSLLQSPVSIGNVVVEVRQGDEVYRVDRFDLDLGNDSGGNLSISGLALPGRDEEIDLSARLVAGEHRLSLEALEIGDRSRIERLRVSEPEPGRFDLDAFLVVAGGRIAARCSSIGEAEIRLQPGSSISLADLVPEAEDAPPLRGTVSDLDLTFTGPFENPAEWKIGGTLVGSGISRGDWTVDTLAIWVEDETLRAEARGSGIRFDSTLVFPYRSASDPASLGDLPVRGRADAEVERIAGLLATLGIGAGLDGRAVATLENLLFHPPDRIESGDLEARVDEATWRGHALPTLDLAARVEEAGSIAAAASLALDPENHLRAGGTLSLEEMRYEASARGELAIRNSTRAFLEEYDLALSDGAAEFEWSGDGTIEPAHHRGELGLEVTGLRHAGGPPLDLDTAGSYDADSAELPEFTIQSSAFEVSGNAVWDGKSIRVGPGAIRQGDHETARFSAGIPFALAEENPDSPPAGPVEVDLEFDRLDPGRFHRWWAGSSSLAGQLTGAVSLAGALDDLEADGDLRFESTGTPPPSEPESSATLEESDGGGNAPPPRGTLATTFRFTGDPAVPESWLIDAEARLSELRWDNRRFEDVDLELDTDPEGRVVARISATQSGATLDADGSIDLSGATAIEELSDRPLRLDVSLDCPDLALPWRDLAPPRWRGLPLEGDLALSVDGVELREGSLRAGEAALDSDRLVIEGEPLETVALSADVVAPDRIRFSSRLLADEVSGLEVDGAWDLERNRGDARLTAALDLATGGVARRLLASRNIGALLPKKTELDGGIEYDGEAGTFSGDYRIDAAEIRLARESVPIRSVRSEGRFSESSLTGDLSIESDPLSLAGKADWNEGILRLEEWTGNSSGREVLSLSGTVPLAPEAFDLEQWFSSDEPIALDLSVDSLAFSTIHSLIGTPSPLDGTATLALELAGSPAAPAVSARLDLVDLAMSGDREYPAGSLGLELETGEETLNLSGQYRHPDVHPLVIDATTAFHPAAWATGGRPFSEEPIRLEAKMDRSSLGFLATQVPVIESIAGDAALDLVVSGTVSAPQIEGDGSVSVERLRLQPTGAPSFYDIHLDTTFSKNRITVDRLAAIIAGGQVEASGTVGFEPGEDPRLDFRIDGSEVLLFRNPDVSLRTDVEMLLRGPWSRVAIEGELAIVNSRYFRNFDLLPTSLPAPETSTLPQVDRGPRGGGSAYSDLNFGVEVEPFRDWPTSIRVHTADPFLIRSNLVDSALEADVRIGGTLGRPAPDGYVRIAEGELSLPFSSVDVETGRIRFDENTGFNGSIELKARAKADDYRANIYLYNRILDPKYVLTSVPPLPSEDIITLLLTGSTRDDLIGDDAGSIAASRAATLLIKNFRKASAKADREPNLIDELQDRTELDIGGVNPETGAETIGGRIRLWKQLFFVGNVDASNDYRAVLKYVFRFR